MQATLTLPETTLAIRPWPDAVIDSVGIDPRSPYVERFWLPILGPSTTWLLRRLVTGLEREPAGFEVDLADTARCLGLGDKGGRNSPFVRALTRCVQFDLAQPQAPAVLGVRRRVPPLARRHLVRLPESLREEHCRWQREEHAEPPVERMRRRSRQLALSLIELGEDLEAAERQLMRWQFHPSIAHESARWAWQRHLDAEAAAAAPTADDAA